MDGGEPQGFTPPASAVEVPPGRSRAKSVTGLRRSSTETEAFFGGDWLRSAGGIWVAEEGESASGST